MVVKFRSPSRTYVGNLQNRKASLPHCVNQVHRAASTGSIIYGDGQMHQESSAIQRLRTPSPTMSECLGPDSSSRSLFQDSKKSKKLASYTPLILKITFVLAVVCAIYSLRSELSKRDNELASIRSNFDYVEDALLQNEAKVDKAHNSLQRLQSQFINLLPQGQEHNVARGEDFNVDALYKKIVDRQVAMQGRVSELQDTISGLHREEAIEHFGSQKYKVGFNLRVDQEIISFVVEMAPLDMVPHSVHFFLEMVKAQVWDNTVFSHNSNHIVLAELKDPEGNDKRNIFLERGISTLSFPEYNPLYPHKKYTLGFGGRPGGPGFYINTEDNSEIHGPGGQSDYHLGEEADPCFGTVVEGQHVIDWMQDKYNLHSSDTVFTVIDSIRIIENKKKSEE